jgi:amino acid adenylation domain-containing protein
VSTASIPGRFAQAAAQFAARIAVNAPAGQWTYAELDQHSNFFAAEIVKLLGETSEPVALLMQHDAPLIAAILGTLKANKIYCVPDLEQPPAQLAATLAASGANLLLADSAHLALANSLAAGALKIFSVSEIFPAAGQREDFPEVSADAAAWLMFTSGSSAMPKGVWQNHRGILQESEIYAELIGLTPADRVSLLTACGLSASGATLFATLFNGAMLCPFHVRSQGTGRLADWLVRERISIFHSVPTVFRHLVRAACGKNSFASVRLIRLGGEPVLRRDAEMYRQHCPDHCRFMQSLSSTETGLISTHALDKKIALPAARLPAGRAVPGVELFLVDENHQPVRNGDEGKIAIRSTRLRQGYWRQPALTAKNFLNDPLDPAVRIFISNDLGKFLPDGTLAHLGRADQLVKIHGQRVDLSEVEAALLTLEPISAAAVIAREGETGELRLTAFVVSSGGAETSPQWLRRELRRHLPAQAIPCQFVALEKLPELAAGKIDRTALPALALPANNNGLSRNQRAREVLDKRLVRIWESALNFSPIGRQDDFFELGGTSLQAVEVLLNIEELFGVALPPATLAEHSTIEQLAALLAEHAIIPSPSPLVTLRKNAAGRPLFLIHSGQGDVTSYGLLARRILDRPIYGLQSVGLQGESWPLKNVPAMARRYLPEIVAHDPTGPYLLAGTCMGGMVALELAQLLVRQGKKVGLLGLLDSQFPMPPPVPAQTRSRRIYVSVRTPVHDTWRKLRWRILRAFGQARNASLLPAYRRFVAGYNSLANQSYQPTFYPGEITLFLTTDSRFDREDSRLRIRSLAQSARIISIPGNRAGLFATPAVDELARQLQTCLAAAERENRIRSYQPF